jgi:hypothetical protein
LGINPAVVKNGITKATEYASAATTIGSAIFAGFGAKKIAETRPAPSSTSAATSSWGGWGSTALAFGGTLLVGAAAGSAYYKRNDLNQGFSSLMDHMKYAGSAWDEQGLRSRIDALVDAQEKRNIIFHKYVSFNHFLVRTQSRLASMPIFLNPRLPILYPGRS